MKVAVVLWSCWLNLQGVENPWRFFVVLSSRWLNLQGVEKPWRLLRCCRLVS
ncbi:MAG: hypothetical protein GDA51_05140 [Ekhidna sp.]|nr:hypothetical protein [Ekhidna sp.]MBC6425849.1 hypothetical protein [Ekhidna sp.]